ncbi:MAG TPA: hypothetical protein VHI11_08165 [Jiangellaceae bacterium]|jgi:hypothetical protein|nr:hypothetical protein [Jiangellaceae bacterium]
MTHTIGPAAPAAADVVDLATWLTEFTAPMSSGQPYREPTAAESADAVMGLWRMLGDGRAEALMAPLGFTVISGFDSVTGRPLVLAFSEGPPGERAWAGVLVDASTPVQTVIGCPHPIFDIATERLGLELWQRMPGSLLLVAGAHRRADDGRADPRDHPGSLFHKFAAVLLGAGLPHIQLHGFADASAPGLDVVLSPGATTASVPITRVGDSLAAHGLAVARAWQVPVPNLGGTTNIQGRSAADSGAVFIHVEMSATARATMSEPLIAALSGADVAGAGWPGPILAQAVAGQFPATVGTANTVGTSRYGARADHRHAERRATVDRVATLESDRQRTTERDQPGGYPGLSSAGKIRGSQQLYARTGTIKAVGPTAAAGAANSAARGDHVHPGVAPDDPRLSDVRVPTPHVHAAEDLTSGRFDTARLPLADPPTVLEYGPVITVDHTTARSFALTASGALEIGMNSETPADGAAVLLEVFASGTGTTVTLAPETGILGEMVPPFIVPPGKLGLFGLRYSARAGRWVLVSVGVEQ